VSGRSYGTLGHVICFAAGRPNFRIATKRKVARPANTTCQTAAVKGISFFGDWLKRRGTDGYENRGLG